MPAYVYSTDCTRRTSLFVDNEGPRSTIAKPKGAPTGHEENCLNYARIVPCLAMALALAACSARVPIIRRIRPLHRVPRVRPLRAARSIGVSIQNREAQFYQDMEAGMQAEARRYGYTLIVVDANRDNAKQQSQVEDFISKKVDAIVLTPYDSHAIGSAIVEANNANIPVFTADIANAQQRRARWSRISPATTCRAASRPASSCARRSGTAAASPSSTSPRSPAFKTASKASNPRWPSCVRTSRSWPTRLAAAIAHKANSDMGDILQSHKDLKGVFGINDDSALGAVTAVKAAGLTGKVAVVGYDATPEARAAIASGAMYGDAIQYPDQDRRADDRRDSRLLCRQNAAGEDRDADRHVHPSRRQEIARPPV